MSSMSHSKHVEEVKPKQKRGFGMKYIMVFILAFLFYRSNVIDNIRVPDFGELSYLWLVTKNTFLKDVDLHDTFYGSMGRSSSSDLEKD